MRKKRLITAEKEEIIALYKGGVSVVDIATKVGRSKVTVHKIVEFLSISKEPIVQFSVGVHPSELLTLDALFLEHGITNRSNGLRKMIRSAGGYFEERDDVLAEWKALRKTIEGIANNCNQIATACNVGKVDMSGELPELYKTLSRNHYKLTNILSLAFIAVDKKKLVDHPLRKALDV